jgi:hypothetical protein
MRAEQVKRICSKLEIKLRVYGVKLQGNLFFTLQFLPKSATTLLALFTLSPPKPGVDKFVEHGACWNAGAESFPEVSILQGLITFGKDPI